jgi:hypothetical protein
MRKDAMLFLGYLLAAIVWLWITPASRGGG